jgi:hypothetical protein
LKMPLFPSCLNAIITPIRIAMPLYPLNTAITALCLSTLIAIVSVSMVNRV